MNTLLAVLFLSLVGHSFQGTLLPEDDDDVDIGDDYGDVDEAGDDEAKEYCDNSGNVGNEMSRKLPCLYPLVELERLRQLGIDDNTTIVEYTAKVYYTLDVAESYEDIDFYMAQAEARVNAAYINSKIPIRIKIICIEKMNIRDSEHSLKEFKRQRGGDGEDITAVRGTADVAIMIVMNQYNKKYSGVARGDAWRTGHTSVMICSRGVFGFGLAHELGHSFGASHDVKDLTQIPPPKYPWRGGANFDENGVGYKTIMAGNLDGRKRRNVLYYSGPDVFYKDTGIPTGSETRNNARVIKENRFGMAAVGDESETCTTWKRSEVQDITGSCRETDVVYVGIQTEPNFATLTAEACEASCKEDKECTNWSWFDKSRKKQQQCYWNTTLRYKEAKKGAVSGQLSMC